MSIRSAIEDVARFHAAMGIEDLAGNAWLNMKRLRKRLIKEEFKEMKRAIRARDMVGVADAYADMIFVLLGSALVQVGKMRFVRIWQEVVRSNMAKSINGKVMMREDGKVLKPEGWTPPDITSILHLDEPPSSPSMLDELGFAMDMFQMALEQAKSGLSTASDPETINATKAALEQLGSALKEMHHGIQELL